MPATTDCEALLAAIIAQPDEDTPRLAYADLLDENGGEADAWRRADALRGYIAAVEQPALARQ